MLKKNVLFTFDYELYLGKNSGFCYDSLIHPTNKIIEILNKFNFKGIFFVDTLYLWQLKNFPGNKKLQQDLKNINKQLSGAISNGHFVFPHIHPHWLDAKLNPDGCTWNLENLSKYRFHNISDELQSIVFENSINIIKDLYKNANTTPGILGYRAGGWCIQPFIDFKPFFLKYGINHDFSVLPGFYNLDEKQFFDFRIANNSIPYKLSFSDINETSEEGEFFEWPISKITFSVLENFLNKVIDKILWKLNNKALGKGIGAKLSPMQSIDKSEMLSFELLTFSKLRPYLSVFKKQNFIHFITHPKMVSEHNLLMVEKMLNRINSRYLLESDFLEIYNHVKR